MLDFIDGPCKRPLTSPSSRGRERLTAMPQTKIDGVAREVLAHYPADIAGCAWTPLGNAGGFSGAQLWRGQSTDGEAYCLRAWPRGKIWEERLNLIHSALAEIQLPIVPTLEPTRSGKSWVCHREQFWEVATWMPGKADFHAKPTDARLFAAIRVLASVHQCWKPQQPQLAPCPAVSRIIKAINNWRQLVRSGFKPDFKLPFSDEIKYQAKRAWSALAGTVIGIEFELLEWESRPMPIQTCLCDVWHDHILYEGDAVTGLIDFGAVKQDCVAIDLARLLGSMIPDERERMNRALAMYSAINSPPEAVLKLVPILDRVGAVIGLTNWMRWLYHEKKLYPESAQVVRRMGALLKRVEKKPAMEWNPFANP